MKKLILLYVIFSLNYFFTAAQTPSPLELREKNTYADAVVLSNLFSGINDTLKRAELFAILNSYGWEKGVTNNFIFDKVLKLNDSAYNFNPQHITDDVDGDGIPDALETDLFTSKNNEPPSGNIQSAAINALATFMEKRAKEEVMYYAVDKIFDIVNDPGTVGTTFNNLFPNTSSLLKKLKAQGVYYYSDFSLLQQMVESDLKKLPQNFYKVVPASDHALRDGCFVAGEIYDMVIKGERITDLINTLGTSDAIWTTDHVKEVSHLIQLVSNAVTAPDGSTTIWLNSSQLSDLDPARFPTDVTGQFFYGLLIQQIRTQPELATLTTGLNSTGNVTQFVSKFFNLKKLAPELNSLKDSIQRISIKADLTSYIRLFRQTLNVLEDANKSANQLLNGDIIPASFFVNAQKLIEVIENVEQKKYAEAATTVTYYLLQNSSFDVEALRKINFFIQLANLKDEASFTNFLESYTAPIGSSSLKRNAKFNLSVNGYVGFDGGYEWITNGHDQNKRDAFFGGVTAPIGISFSGFPSKAGSLTLSLSAIDIGSLVNARINGDSTNYSNLKLNQFFAPGFGIYYNIKGTPISVGGNCNWISNVRDIKYEKEGALITETNRNVFRASLSLLIDIPFFTLSNKPKS